MTVYKTLGVCGVTDYGPKSWAPEVIADSSGNWAGNALRFADKSDAERWVKDLSMRWFAVVKTRVVESSDEPNRQKGEI